MGNTVNNNWPYPESSDLVKDGATAIENLADAIDTTLGVYTPATPGLVQIGSTISFSGVTSQSLNNVFTSAYRNYKIIGQCTKVSDGDINFRLRASGSDLATNIYAAGRLVVGAGASVAFASSNNVVTSEITVGNIGTTGGGFSLDLIKPNVAERKGVLGFGTGRISFFIATEIQSTTQADGFSLNSADNITGTISVYGYNQ